jgi:3',5'-cyclic AMP phosphodiesterase CpdA
MSSRRWLVMGGQAGLAVALAAAVMAASRVGEQLDPPGVPGAPALDPRTPERVILTWKEAPHTSQAVTWRTDAPVAAAVAEIAPASPNPAFVKTATRTTASTRALPLTDRTVHYHEASFTGLLPDTQYAYRVGDGEIWSEWFHFRTAAAGPAPFEFLYVGDAQNDIRSLWSRAIRSAWTSAPRARFIVHAGDLVNVGESDGQWQEWFDAGGWLNGMLPSVPTVGNHEYGRLQRDAPRRLSPFWRPQFALPDNAPPGLEETVYALDFQGTRLIVLNSMERTRFAEQASWLETRLANNPNRWTIVAFHHPVFSLASTRDNPELRQAWQPLFDKYQVDLVLTGHDHTYGRGTNVLAGAPRRKGPQGTVYIVSVSGPKMYEVGPGRDWAVRTGAHTQLFQVIRVEPAQIRFEARTATGELFDAFDLRKDARGRKRLVDRAPSSPPNAPVTVTTP